MPIFIVIAIYFYCIELTGIKKNRKMLPFGQNDQERKNHHPFWVNLTQEKKNIKNLGQIIPISSAKAESIVKTSRKPRKIDLVGSEPLMQVTLERYLASRERIHQVTVLGFQEIMHHVALAEGTANPFLTKEIDGELQTEEIKPKGVSALSVLASHQERIDETLQGISQFPLFRIGNRLLIEVIPHFSFWQNH
jgi:ribosomal protein L24E